jgi:O-antigen/teichoic acid export membrane protein
MRSTALSNFLTIETPAGDLTIAGGSAPTRLMARLLSVVPGMRGTSITQRLVRAVHGSAWTMAGYGTSQVLKLASTLVLARLLIDPSVFGLVALVNVFLSGLEAVSDLGIGLDVVQHPRGEEPVFLDTGFIVQAGRSVLLALIAVLLAVPFAAFYHQPEVRSLAIVGALSTGIRGFASMSIWLMTRKVQLGKLTAVNVAGDATGLLVSIIWALISPTAWALVAGKVATSFAYVIASHLVADRLPLLRVERKAARDMLIFGGGIFLSSATYFLAGESERLVVGKFATVAELGCFSLALSMSYAPFGILQRIISNVFFPMLAETARQDTSKIAVHFRKFRLAFLVASLLMAVGFITLSHKTISLVLRPQYADTAWMLQLLGFRSALELFGSAVSAMLLAVGITRYTAMGNTSKLIFLAVGLTIAFTRFGLREAIWVLAISPIAHYAPLLFGLFKRYRFAIRTELACFGLFVLATAITAILYRALPVLIGRLLVRL